MPRYNKILIDTRTKANGKKEYYPWASNGVRNERQELGVVAVDVARKCFALSSTVGKVKCISFESKQEALDIITDLIIEKNKYIELEEGEIVVDTKTETINI